MEKKIFALIVLLTSINSLPAQDFYQIQNRWKSNEFIHVEQPQPTSGLVQPGWWSAQWELVLVDQYYYQIKNRWRNEYLHIENGSLQCGQIQPGWLSAQWTLEPVDDNFVRIRSRWKPEIALNNQQGYLEASPINLGWWSAQWQTVKVGATQGSTEGNSQPAINTSSSSSEVTFTPQHNGTIAEAYVRYDDQIWILNLSTNNVMNVEVGNRIYFFPQEVSVRETKGLSFDPKNPSIGGQTFIVIEAKPNIKLDRLMPDMRSDSNPQFKFKVEVF